MQPRRTRGPITVRVQENEQSSPQPRRSWARRPNRLQPTVPKPKASASREARSPTDVILREPPRR